MTPERWRQIKQVCELALEREPDERAAFVTEACAGDPQLRAQVDGLLQHASAGGLESPILAQLATAVPARNSADDIHVPEQIGRYRVIRMVGQGGMGTVYEAEQDSPRRRVALKVVRPGLGSREMFKRFERESQALGRLQHPGIAQVFDAGAAETPFGSQPYFAMEFIDGTSLKEYVAANRVEVPGRLELVARICDAVQHAHDRGIIHRDLKPGNVLIDRSGQPKVLDFGVARLVEGSQPETLHTVDGQLVGTLAYMSPEQVLGDSTRIDARSDVYAIGVLLYELLAGRMPYDVTGRQHEAVQAILRDDPGPLSTIGRQFRGDVETIVAKALEKQPDRRYVSAAALAMDLRRYLAHEPITARPASAAYQLQKFVRRHTAIVAGATAVFVVLAAGTAVSTWQALRARAAERQAVDAEARARQQRDEAVREQNRAVAAEHSAQDERNRAVAAQEQAQAQRARAVEASHRATTEAAIAQAVRDFLQSDLLAQSSAQQQAAPDVKPDPDLTVRTALDRAAARVPARFRNQPLVEASVRETIGSAYQELGLYAEARTQLERVRGLRASTLGAGAEQTLEATRSLALVTMQMGDYPAAKILFHEALEGLTRRRGPTDVIVLDVQAQLVELDLQMGQYQAAEALIEKTIGTERRVLGSRHPLVLASLSGLGRAQIALGHYPEAEASFRTLLEGLRHTKGADHPETLSTESDLAETLEIELKYPEAERLYNESLEGERRVLGADHPYTLTTANNLAVLYKKEGKYAAAEPLYTAAVEGRRRVLGPEHPDTLSAMNNLGAFYVSEKLYADAERLLTNVLATRQRILGPEHPNTLNTMMNLAQAYNGLGRQPDTERLYAQVLSIRQRILGPEHPDTILVMGNLGVLYSAEARYDEAERLLEKVLDVRRRSLGDKHPNTAQTIDNLAALFFAKGDAARAQQLFGEALEIRRATLGADHAETLRSQANLAEALVEGQDLDRGVPLLEDAVARSRRTLGADHDVTLIATEYLALARRRQGRLDDARALLTASLDARRRLLGPLHRYTIEDAVDLALVLLEQHEDALAESTTRPIVAAGLQPSSPWFFHAAKSVLGAALAGQKRFDEAERELLQAHEGLTGLGERMPAQERVVIGQTIERLVALYHAWGKEDRAALWASRLTR
jgi:non-specific serine/threonine protein kinase/serine/threonine-protein kinase